MVELVLLSQADAGELEAIRRALEEVGTAPPSLLVLVGSGETRLEVRGEEEYVLHVSLPLDRYRLLRELGALAALTDPALLELWSLPDELRDDQLAAELSTAMLSRLADAAVARVDPSLLPRGLQPVEGPTVRHSLVRTMAVDRSVSLALAGLRGPAEEALAAMAGHPLYPAYRRFWELAILDFRLRHLYNLLLAL